MQPRHPLYIPSKGRSQFMLTSRVLTKMGVAHSVIAEPHEIDLYRAAIAERQLLADVVELDLDYKRRYELCDEHGLAKSTGPGPARNFAWDHAKARGAGWHWVMDDNLRAFYRLHRNEKHLVQSGAFFAVMEDFTERYSNVAMAGPNYELFAKRKFKVQPFSINTRIYSCNLIRNDLNFRWRGRYNEDTILSLDMLKAGWCTIQFNAYLQHKTNTQQMPGGNTAEFYEPEGAKIEGQRYTDTGTLAKSLMLARVHPDCARVVWKFGRIHHVIDVQRFRNQKLVLRAGHVPPERPAEYGMRLVPVAA